MSKQPRLTTVMEAAFSKFFEREVRVSNKQAPSWNANLSFKTYNALKRQGVMQ